MPELSIQRRSMLHLTLDCTDTRTKSPVFLLGSAVLRNAHLRGHDLVDLLEKALKQKHAASEQAGQQAVAHGIHTTKVDY
jgi:hypothetical protein